MAASVSGMGRRLGWGGFWVGFALGGFLDGILLHQVLQWHHLLSAWAPGQDLRFQVVADGWFHAAHYLAAGAGLWLLWAGRGAAGEAAAERRMLGLALAGFGAWHIVDAVLVHWVLGMHRIRMDTAAPLLWDLGWLVPFGLVPAALGAWVLRRPGGNGRGGGRAATVPLVLAVLAAGPVAALPARGADGMAMVVFRPGMGLGAVVAAADAVGGRLVAETGGVWVIATEGGAARLYRHGALLVADGWLPAGCLGWSRRGPAPAG